jgi:uncharacterized membrane protein YbhN (UPF0104 family)
VERSDLHRLCESRVAVRRSRLAALSTAIGLIVAAAGAVFVARAIATSYDSTRDAIADADLGWLLASLPIAFAGMTLVGVPWRRSMRLLGADPTLRDTLVWYFLGQLGKYVPGTVWPIVGRAELARRGGVNRAAAYGSVVLTLGATYLAAVLVVLGFLPFAGENGASDQWWSLLLLPIGLVVLHPRILGWGKQTLERITRRQIDVVIPPWRDSVELVARHAPAWFFIGTATWCVARAFDPTAGWAELMVPSVLSWVIGFLVVPAPGGIGVREFAFATAAVSLGDGVGATVALVSRLVFMIVDATGALVATTLRARRGRTADTKGMNTP